MIKVFKLNQKRVPIPVPLSSVQQLVSWLSSDLISGDYSITRLRVDQREIDLFHLQSPRWDLPLDEDSQVEILVESPLDLLIKTLDGMRNLAMVVEGFLKPTAVELWRDGGKVRQTTLTQFESDLELLVKMIQNIHPMLLEYGSLSTESFDLRFWSPDLVAGLELARSQQDWKGYAKILLNRLETALDELVHQSVSIQSVLCQIKGRDVRASAV